MVELEELRKKLREGSFKPKDEYARLRPEPEANSWPVLNYWWSFAALVGDGDGQYRFVFSRKGKHYAAPIKPSAFSIYNMQALTSRTLEDMGLPLEIRQSIQQVDKRMVTIWSEVQKMILEARAHWEKNRA